MAELKYVPEPFEWKYQPLPWQVAGLQQTASGYGMRLTSTRVVRLPGETRWRRVYVTQFSNAGTAWIRVKGEKLIVPDFGGTEVQS